MLCLPYSVLYLLPPGTGIAFEDWGVGIAFHQPLGSRPTAKLWIRDHSRSVLAVVAGVACTVAAVLPSFLLGGLASLVRTDLRFNEARLGLAVGCFYAASALTAIPGGRIAERLGARRSLAVGITLAVTSLAGIALLTTEWLHLAAFIAVGGVSNGVVQPAAALALARGVRQERLGIAFGIKQSAVPVATLLAGLAVPLIGLTVGWRWAFGGAAVATIGLLGILPQDGKAPNRERRRVQERRPRIDRSQLPALARIALASGCGAVAANSMGAFYVESAVSSGERLALAGLLLSFGSICGIITRLAVGWVADRTTFDPLRMVGLMLISGTAGYLMLGHTAGTGLLVVGTFVAFAGGWGWPGLMQLAVVQDHMGAPAAASGIAHAGALTGGLIGPITFGWVVSTRGYSTAWSAVSVVALVAGCVLLWERRARQEGAPA